MLTETFEKIKGIVIGLHPEYPSAAIRPEEHINDYIDSISMFDFLLQLEEAFSISIEPENINPNDFGSFESVGVLVERLQNS